MFKKKNIWLGAVAIFAGATMSHAANVFELTELLATPDAAVGPTKPLTFPVATAGDVTLTLTDLQTPTALSSLRAIVTRDLKVAATLEVSPAMGNTASVTFAAEQGTYGVHVLGAPATDQAGGSFGVRVAGSGGASLLEVADVIAANPTVTGYTTLQSDFTISQAGSYQLSATDHAFPGALASTQVLLMRQTNGAPVPVLTLPGTFDAQPGAYTLIVIAKAGAAEAGLFTAEVKGASPTPVFRATRAVGRMPSGTSITLPTTGQYSTALTDLEFPDALASLAAVLVQQNSVVTLSAGGATIDASAGDAMLFAVATATSDVGIGAFSFKISQSNQVVSEGVKIADDSPDPATPAIYSVSSPNSIAAGDYKLTLKDFAFPAAFASVQAAITQGSTFVGRLNTPTESPFTLSAAPVKILIAARPRTAGTGLFSILLAPQPGGSTTLESTQGVGGVFSSVPVAITTDGQYDVTLADLQFPVNLSSSALAITQGTTLVGQIFGAGTLARQELRQGTYVLNFQGIPAATAKYGTYGLRISDTSSAPTLEFSAVASSIASGQQATLQWSATDATSCTASNGWTGTKATSGTQSVGPLTTMTTFELNCTGAGGSISKSVTVAVSSASTEQRRKGGGGSTDLILICALLALLSVSRSRGSVARGGFLLRSSP